MLKQHIKNSGEGYDPLKISVNKILDQTNSSNLYKSTQTLAIDGFTVTTDSGILPVVTSTLVNDDVSVIIDGRPIHGYNNPYTLLTWLIKDAEKIVDFTDIAGPNYLAAAGSIKALQEANIEFTFGPFQPQAYQELADQFLTQLDAQLVSRKELQLQWNNDLTYVTVCGHKLLTNRDLIDDPEEFLEPVTARFDAIELNEQFQRGLQSAPVHVSRQMCHWVAAEINRQQDGLAEF